MASSLTLCGQPRLCVLLLLLLLFMVWCLWLPLLQWRRQQ